MKIELEWFSVKEALPEVNDVVLVRRSKFGFQLSNFHITEYDRWGFNLPNVTHWAHLPNNKLFGKMLEEDDIDEEI